MELNPTVDRERLGMWLVAVALFAVLAFVAYAYVGAVVLGLFVYYVARPVYDRIRRVVPTRSLAALTALLAFILPVLVLFAWTLGLAVQELVAFASGDALGDYVEMLEPYVELGEIDAELDALVERLRAGNLALPDLGGSLSGVLGAVFASLGVLGSGFFTLLIAGVVGFYLLRDDYRLVTWGHRTVAPEGGVVAAYLAAVDRDLKTVYFGNILTALLTGIIAAVTYNLLDVVAPAGVGVPVPTLLGVLTGAASLVPVVGIKLTYVPAFAYLLGRSALADPGTLWFPLAFVAVSIVVVDLIPDLVLRPYVSGRNIHVGALMLAYIVGPLLFGWYGLFLGPLLLVAVFEFAIVVAPWLAASPGETPPPLADEEEGGPAADEAGEPAPEPTGDGEAAASEAGDGTAGPEDGPGRPPDGDPSPED